MGLSNLFETQYAEQEYDEKLKPMDGIFACKKV